MLRRIYRPIPIGQPPEEPKVKLVNLERLKRMESTLTCSPIAVRSSRDLCHTVRALRQALSIALVAWETRAGWGEGDDPASDEHTEYWLCQSVLDETGPPDV